MRKTTAIDSIKIGKKGGVCIPRELLKKMRKNAKAKIANINSLFKVNVIRYDDCMKVSFDDRIKDGTTVDFLRGTCQFYAGRFGDPGDELQAEVTDDGELILKA